MDPVVLTIIIRGVVCLFLLWGAYKQFMAGLRLFKKGVDEPGESALFEFKGFKFHSKHVGTVVMATASFWALLAVWAIPNYESSRRGVRVYSFEAKDIQAHVPQISASTAKTASAQEALSKPEELKTLFKKAVTNRSAAEAVTINAATATLDLSNVTVSQDADGTMMIHTPAQADGTKAQVNFKSELKGNEIIFTPASVKNGKP